MWCLKLKLMHKDCHIGALCKKYSISTFAFPLGGGSGIYKKNNQTVVAGIHLMSGEEKNKKLFLNKLKKDKAIQKLEINGNRFSYLLKLSKKNEQAQLYYTPKLIFLKPVINSADGFEYWEIAAWDKKALIEFMKKIKKHMDYFEVMKLGKENLADVFFPQIMPKLSEKQIKSLKLAFKRGYYKYPKKTDLHKLAKENNVSAPTFQEHLKKAEIKLINSIIEQII